MKKCYTLIFICVSALQFFTSCYYPKRESNSSVAELLLKARNALVEQDYSAAKSFSEEIQHRFPEDKSALNDAAQIIRRVEEEEFRPMYNNNRTPFRKPGDEMALPENCSKERLTTLTAEQAKKCEKAKEELRLHRLLHQKK